MLPEGRRQASPKRASQQSGGDSQSLHVPGGQMLYAGLYKQRFR